MEGSVSLIDQHQAPARSRPSLALRQPTQIVILNGTPPPQDYSHASVTADTFLAVLAGNASGVPPPSRHSSGRVLQAGPQDKVFVYYRCSSKRVPQGAAVLLGMWVHGPAAGSTSCGRMCSRMLGRPGPECMLCRAAGGCPLVTLFFP